MKGRLNPLSAFPTGSIVQTPWISQGHAVFVPTVGTLMWHRQIHLSIECKLGFHETVVLLTGLTGEDSLEDVVRSLGNRVGNGIFRSLILCR